MTLSVIDQKGDAYRVERGPGGSLMEALRDLPEGVTATCGGMLACGTCHIFVAEEWLDRLEPLGNDESAILDGLIHARSNSRLSCQVALTAALDGIAVTVAPEE